MRLQVALSVLLIVLVVGVLGVYLIRVAALLSNVAETLAKVSFGVRAIEQQASLIEPSVKRLNERLDEAVSHLPSAARRR